MILPEDVGFCAGSSCPGK